MTEFLETYPWTLPFIIFFGRICDVSLGTLRIVFVSRGARNIAPVIGFVEVFIWIVIIAQVFNHADGFISYFCYALGYAAGTYIGLTVENMIGFGYVKVSLFTKSGGPALVGTLNQHGYGATLSRGEGAFHKVDIVQTVVRRVNIREVEGLMRQHDPDAFHIIEDVRTRHKGIFAKYL
ncbi:hypothetical protein C4J81_01215 [Deltaproteobacteria bacterium Smac51]|nr:hypothetical protein C4J81_01215 [Deltaproteobacteria bacterium Smac51]